MKKIINLLQLTACAGLLFGSFAFAVENNTDGALVVKPAAQLPVIAPKLTVTASTSFYELHGHKSDDRKNYDFDRMSAQINLLNINFGIQGGWSANLLLQNYEFYTESIFPSAPLPQWQRSNDKTTGAGDTYLTFIAPMQFVGSWMLIPDFGVSIPTGHINYKSKLQFLEQSNLAYNAQHGSGTYDVLLGATAIKMISSGFIFGNHVLADIRTGKNSNDYSLGNMYKYDTWLDYNTSYGLTPRLVGAYKYKEAIRGFDKSRGNAADDFYYHAQKDWSVSAALKASKSFMNSAISLSAEVGVPFAQANDNFDHSEVIAKYYGHVALTGSF
jgi:hypothetical protein